MPVRKRSTLLRQAIRSLLCAAPIVAIEAGGQELPVPCSAGACGVNGPQVWVSDGNVTGARSGSTFTVTQLSDRATLNWASFNIGPNGTVNFEQPGRDSVALNRIFQADPSRIFGALNSNGQVYLLNQNGIVFGENAVVNVGSLIASTLDLTPQAVENGILGASRQQPPAAAFALFVDADGNPLPSAAITVENGAFIGAEEGQIFLFAPEVVNRGEISTPSGQTILAAGEKIYLAASSDPNLNGLLVEVDGEGVVTNGEEANAGRTPEQLLGQILAERGNITLAGLAVNQLGRVSATTTVRQNGAIRLIARNEVTVRATGAGDVELLPSNGGFVTLGESSVTEVVLADDDATTVDVNEQPRSFVEIDGRDVDILDDAAIVATAGEITITARPDPRVLPDNFEPEPGEGRLYVAPGARLDVSGSETDLSIERNIVDVQLLGNQLRDSPAQRGEENPIRGETVKIDIRESGVRADGSAWQGTPLADASGEISNIERDVHERNLAGGSISVSSQGQVVVAEDAVLDVSGGKINFADGDVTTSRLLGVNGQLYDISDADRDRNYLRVADAFVVEHPKWGVTEVFEGYPGDIAGNFEAGYIEGKDAGSVTLVAPRFAMDGEILATTERGRYQRLAPGAIPEDSLYRPFDQVPLGGGLVLGSVAGAGSPPNYVLDSLHIDTGSVLVGLSNAAGDPFDPRVDELPADYVSRLDPALIADDRVTRLSVFANGDVIAGDDISLELPGNGELRLTGAEVRFDGDYRSASGVFDLQAEITRTRSANIAVSVGADSRIDVAGVWANDNPLLEQPEPLAPLFVDGGTVSIRADSGNLTLAEGSSIDVSGGAQREPLGSIVAGRGGLVSLGTRPFDQADPVETTIGSDLTGFALFDGARLEISASTVCIDSANCAGDEGEIWLTPDLYISHGFADIDVTANLVGLELAEGAQISAIQRNYLLPNNGNLFPSTSSLAGFARVVTLPRVDRRPVDLRLATQVDVPVAPDLSQADSAPILLLGTGSRIDADPGAVIQLSSTSRIDALGSIIAPAGSVSLRAIRGGLPPQSGVRGVRLGGQSFIDVSGTTLIRDDALGRRVGQVLDGGEITLRANLGSVITDPGSVLRLNGTTGELDIIGGNGANPVFIRRTIGSDGGTLAITAAEAVLFNSSVSAIGGNAEGTSGGSLEILIDGNIRGGDPGGATAEPVFSLNPRRVVVSQERSPVVVPPGSGVPAQFIGDARIAADTIQEAGFADLSLDAATMFNLRFGTSFRASLGEILFDGPVKLDLPGNLRLNAPNIGGGGGDVSLSANYLILGYEDPGSNAQAIGNASPTALGRFAAEANLVDLVGNVRLRGFDSAGIESRGDIRMIGEQSSGSRDLSGSLTTAADLFFAASQIYPTTLTDYRITAEADDSLIEFAQVATAPAPVLSAAGRLSVDAANIVQAGTLLAPFGEIELNATNLEMAAGSRTSTSLEGAVIPFGNLQGGIDWTYSLESNQTLVFNGDLNELPQQRISLNGDRVGILEGALVDVSAGGDLLAYEFIPGLGGSDDFLSDEVSPNTFAILPGSNIDFAPYDPAESPGVGLRVGDAVFLEGVGDLPEGEYTLLPARYALLPGSVLVTSVEGYADILPNERFFQLDGSVIVAGRRVQSGTGFIDDRTSGFALRPGTDALIEAEYQSGIATEFFAGGNLRTPLDAGTLELTSEFGLTLNGELASESPDGRGAEVSVVADRLRIVESLTGDPLAVEVEASALENLRAESVVLGGVRSALGDGQSLAVLSESVSVDEAISLAAPELLLAARQSIDIGAGAALNGEGRAIPNGRLVVDGDAALLRVSAGSQTELERNGSLGLAGDIAVGPDAVIGGAGSVALDASRNIDSQGRLAVSGGSLRLGASAISLGDTTEDVTGLLLGSSQLAELDAAELQLASRSAIGVYGEASLAVAESLTISAPGLVAADDRADLTMQAPSFRVEGTVDDTPPATVAEGVTVRLLSDDAILAGGGFSAEGFSSVDVRATNAVLLSGDGSIDASGALNLGAPLVVADTGSDYAVNAVGRLTLAGQGTADPQDASALGGRLRLSGDSVTLDTTVIANSGTILVEGRSEGNAVELGAAASIDASGATLEFDGDGLSTPGGAVVLSAPQGSVAAADGSKIAVGATGAADGGSLTVSAGSGQVDLAGQIDGGAGSGRGGSLSLDAERFAALPDLFRAAVAGGFNEALSVRQRGSGALTLDSDIRLTANRINLENDGGAIDLRGSVEATGDAAPDISMFARDDIRVIGDVLLAGNPGTVLVESRQGGIDLASGSRVALAGGELQVGADRAILDTLLDADSGNDRLRFDGQIEAADRVVVSGLLSYLDADGQITAAEVAASSSNPRYADLVEFMAGADTIAESLGQADNPAFAVRPGLIVESAGDLALTTDWNLADWRFDGEPGLLSLLAAGDLSFDESLSDGFASAQTADLTATEESWSYRLAAGAAPGAANPLRVRAETDAGDVIIAAGVPGSGRREGTLTAIRTGTGDIDLSAAGDLVFGNQASVIYTAGIDAGGIRLTQRGDLGDRAYPDQGGDINVDVGRDILGATSDQLFTTWLFRTGRGVDTARPYATGWTVNFARFEQGIGTLGGGDLTVTAGRDILDASFVVPSIGRQVGGTEAEDSVVDIVGGGNLRVAAGGDILGGTFLAGKGTAEFRSDGSFGASPSSGLSPIIGLGDASASVRARENVSLQAAITPTLVTQSAAQQTPVASRSFFSTYGEDSEIALTAVSGDLTLRDSASEDADAINGEFEQLLLGLDALSLRVLPPILSARAFSGDIDLEGSITLFPSSSGDLRLLANRDITLGTRNENVQLIVSDVDPGFLPGIDNPNTTLAGTTVNVLTNPNSVFPEFNASTPVHGSNPSPILLVARNGTLCMLSTSLFNRPLLWSAKPAHIVAGTDIENLSLFAQNLGPDSVSGLFAGRDIIFPNERTVRGELALSNRSIDIAGDGALRLVAGRDIDLQTSAGITARGNLRNPALAESGASVTAIAGTGRSAEKDQAFFGTHVVDDDRYDGELEAFLLSVGAEPPADKDGQIELFEALDPELQVEFIDQLYAGNAPGYRAFFDAYVVEDEIYDGKYDEALASFLVSVGAEAPADRNAVIESFDALDTEVQDSFIEQVYFTELKESAEFAAQPDTFLDFSQGFAALNTLFPGANPNLDAGEQNLFDGDLSLFFSRIYTLDGGDIRLLVPGGFINAGLATPPAAFGLGKSPEQLGIVVQRTGDIESYLFGDFAVNESRVFAADGGDIVIWTTRGDVDAGRGARTAISAPPPQTIINPETGATELIFPAALTGSGIQALSTSEGVEAGTVFFATPDGVVNTGDAGITAGNAFIASVAIIGNQIDISGTITGPQPPPPPAPALAGVSAIASSASRTAEAAVGANRDEGSSDTPLADEALGWLDVFVTGFGECDPNTGENCGE